MIDRAPGTLQHAAFFEALAGMSESHPDWAATTAGLLVLRLVDGWLTEGSQAAQVSVSGICALRGAIAQIQEEHAARAILASIVDTIEAAPTPDIRPLAPRLMAYGRLLEHEARWAVAIDVYAALLEFTPPGLAADTVVDAQTRVARCFRLLGRFDEAAAAFQQAKQTAIASGSSAKLLHIEVQESMLAMDRGNLPAAESLLERVIAAADTDELRDVKAMALHNRAAVAINRGQYAAGARFAYDALRLTHSLDERDRVLADLALSLAQLGALESARDAFLVLVSTAQDQQVRWNSMINLMEVGALQMNEPFVERYRRELLHEPLPPALRAAYHYYSAFGYHAAGKFDDAESALAQAEQLAERHGANRLLFQVEELRSAVRQGIAAARRTPVPAYETEAIEDIKESIAQMRELVSV